jgi:hypothetical protein
MTETILDPDTQSPFEDAIEHNEETRELATLEEIPRQNGSTTTHVRFYENLSKHYIQ